MLLGIGIDTGGTYTDAVVYDFDKKQVLAKGKALTTKEDLSIGIGNALDTLPSPLVMQSKTLSLSTTLATNACVENKGGRAKLILLGTTHKVLEWIDAKKTYGFKSEEVFCIDTRNSHDGKVIDNPDWDMVVQTQKEWFEDAQALAVAEVSAMNNGAICEKTAKAKLEYKFAVPFVMANEFAIDFNVMERGATALLNAKLLPIIEEFMTAVNIALTKRHINIKKMVIRSDGSLMSDEWAVKHPVKTILSGPAASVVGGRGLNNCQDCLIVDMGGTTTDISIVVDGQPAMTDGIRIGGYRTQIKGVFIDTFGLGGDSRIVIKNNKMDLSTRRVQPLCIAAAKWPTIKDSLQSLVDSKKVNTAPLHEFLYLVREPKNLQIYNSYKINLIDKLRNEPIMLGSGEIDLYNLNSDRLENEGIIMRCGLTPTDIMHIKGDFCLHDSESSILGVRYLLLNLPEYSDTKDDLFRFCDDIYNLVCSKLYENILRILLINKYPKLFEKGINPQIIELIRHSFIESNSPVKSIIGLNFSTPASLIGIGAPTHIFLPKVAKLLGSNCIIPEHAEVANALGSIIADISANAVIKISPNYTALGIAGYNVYTDDGTIEIEDLDEAIDFAKEIATKTAISDVKKRGALGELSVSINVNPEGAYSSDGAFINLGTTVEAKVTGRVT